MDPVARLGALVVVLIVASGCAGSAPEAGTRSPHPTPIRPAVDVWRRLAPAGAEEIGRYETLAEMTRWAPEIVLARVESVLAGRVFGAEEDPDDAVRSVLVTLSVTERIKPPGAEHGSSVPMELGPVEASIHIEARYGELVGGDVLAFLHRKGTPQVEFGVVEGDADEAALGLYRPVTSQGLFVDDSGAAVAVLHAGSGAPFDLEVTSFSDLVTIVRRHVDRLRGRETQ